VHNITDTNKLDKMGETARTVSRTGQKPAHTAMDYALGAQVVNTEILRRTSQAWIEGFRYQVRLSQGMAQVFWGQWGNAFKSMPPVERPGQEQSGPVGIEPATNGAQRGTEPAAKDVQKYIEIAEKAEKVAREKKKATEVAAKDAQKNTETAAFPIDGYDEMNVGEVSERLNGISEVELKRVGEYEKGNKDRGTLRKEMEQKTETTS
jgi:hypothetical protein